MGSMSRHAPCFLIWRIACGRKNPAGYACAVREEPTAGSVASAERGEDLSGHGLDGEEKI